jgi:hypothetical protein
MEKRKKPIQWERSEQEALVEWFRLAYRNELLAAIPNHLVRGCVQARVQSLSGLVSGMPDLVLLSPRGIYGALFIELKRPNVKGQPKGMLSKNQDIIIGHLRSRGYKCVVCFGWDSAKKEIEEYLNHG